MKIFRFTFISLIILIFTLFSVNSFARDWFVSATKGKGKKGTKIKPAKDLGNIISKLKAGDQVFIAGGVYYGKGKNGMYLIKVPVEIIGGYDETFTKRDPWGKYKTILSGDVKTTNWKIGPRIGIDLMKYREKIVTPILIDGIIVDNGKRNSFKGNPPSDAIDKQLEIVRRANPKYGTNPTPDQSGIEVLVSRMPYNSKWDITVKNCIIMNVASSKGVLHVGGYKDTTVKISNNLIINNTGIGIYADTKYHGKDKQPKFLIENNTVLFTWKYDQLASSFSGVSIHINSGVDATVKNNVFAFGDRIGIQKGGKLPLLLKDNLITGNLGTDYWETVGDAKIILNDLEDEAEYLHEDSENNISFLIKIPVNKNWAELYSKRVLINRNKMEANIKATNSTMNALRGMLGLPLRAGKVKSASSPVWLHRLSIDDAVKAGENKYKTKYGCSKVK